MERIDVHATAPPGAAKYHLGLSPEGKLCGTTAAQEHVTPAQGTVLYEVGATIDIYISLGRRWVLS